jgi:hypothetical protein
MTEKEHSEVIAKLNDQHRVRSGQGWVMTPGVQALGTLALIQAVAAVCGFSDFTEDNDPHGERDFGVFEIDGQRLFWKIDYYDLNLALASPDPADLAVTRRVLTLMWLRNTGGVGVVREPRPAQLRSTGAGARASPLWAAARSLRRRPGSKPFLRG